MPRVGPVYDFPSAPPPEGDVPSGGRATTTAPEIPAARGWNPPPPEPLRDEPRPLTGALLVRTIRAAVEGADARRIHAITTRIHAIGGDPAPTTVLLLNLETARGAPVLFPLFRVHGKDGGEHFVDDAGRSYKSFESWKVHNQLPPGRVSFPENGHWSVGPDGRPRMMMMDTPAVR
jgi:hypothetical protein